jgi:hypothetical protein
MRKPSSSMIVALAALFVSLSGVAVAANGGNFILGHANSASKRTVLSAPVAGGKALQVTNNNTSNAASTALGLNVASGHTPFTVNSGVKVANLNADRLDGIDSSALQRRVTGSCSANSAITQINAAGGVGCTNVKFYSGRLVTAVEGDLSGNTTFLTIPGIAHAAALSCYASGANAALSNDAPGTTDLWYYGDSGYLGTNWLSSVTPFGTAEGRVWHLGKGSGSGATTVTVTVSLAATGSECIFQGTAEVITS